MANAKISALTSATTPLAGTEVLPIVQSGATKKVSIENVTAGRTVNVKYLAVNTTLKTWFASSVPIQFGIGGVLEARDNIAQFSAWATNAYINTAGNDIYIDAGEASRLEQSNGLFRWKTAPSGSAGAACTFTNRMELANATGNLDLKTGNLVVSSGKGIDFSATAGTGTSELLADYEEGTFTPTYVPAAGAFTSITYNATTAATYTKVGRAVHVVITLRTTALVVGTASGAVTIGGLPFTSASSPVYNSLSLSWSAAFGGDYPSGCMVENSSTRAYLTYRTTANGATTFLDVTDLAIGVGNYVVVAGTYFV